MIIIVLKLIPFKITLEKKEKKRQARSSKYIRKTALKTKLPKNVGIDPVDLSNHPSAQVSDPSGHLSFVCKWFSPYIRIFLLVCDRIQSCTCLIYIFTKILKYHSYVLVWCWIWLIIERSSHALNIRGIQSMTNTWVNRV